MLIWVLILIPLLLIVLTGLLVGRIFWRRLTALKASFGMTVLLVLVPRYNMTADGKPATTEQKIADQLAVAEMLWTAIGGLKAQRGLWRWLKGRDDHLSLEIVVQGGVISFYIVVPQRLRSFIEQEIHATYPHAVVQATSDYNIFLPHGVSVGASLNLSRPAAFPLKTYKQFEADPQESILNALARLATPEAAAVQFVVRSAKRSWRRAGVQIASSMQQGKRYNEAAHSGKWAKVSAVLSSFFGSSSKKNKNDNKEPYRLSPAEEQMIKGIEEKASKAGIDVTCRLVVSARDKAVAEAQLSNLGNAFSQFSIYQYGNRLEMHRPSNLNRFFYSFIHRVFEERKRMVLNTEELATIYHFPLPSSENSQIRWLTARQAPPPGNLPEKGLLLGVSDWRGERKEVRMLPADRARHLYVIGKSGTGKSVFLENIAVQDIANGEGVCVIDPHGDLVDAVLARSPRSRLQDIIVFDPAEVDRPQGLNLLEYDPKYPEQKTFVINEMIKIFDKLYDLRQTGGPMFEQYMRNAMLLIMDDPASGSTLMEISKVLADPDYRRYKLLRVKDPVVYDFWVKEAQKAGGEASLANMVPYITSKLNQFVANDIMRPIIGQQHSAFNFREVMDTRKVLLVRLSKGKLGDINAYLLGLVIVGKLLMAALSRTDLPEYQRKNFFLYIDEFQNFITDSIAVILSEARKYRLSLTMAHQYIGQLVNGNDTKIRDAVFGNVGTVVSFRIGVEDAEVLAKEFAPVFSSYDLINVELFQAYVKMLINNMPSRPFNIRTLPPAPGDHALAVEARRLSTAKYGRPRAEVEHDILERAKLTVTPQAQATPPLTANTAAPVAAGTAIGSVKTPLQTPAVPPTSKPKTDALAVNSPNTNNI